MTSRSQPLRHYRRFPRYDYSRGVALFVTLTTSPRRALFGRVSDGGIMHLSPFGNQVLEALRFQFKRKQGLMLFGHVVLPDHVHFRLYLAPGLENAAAMALLNQRVGRFKSYTTHLYQKQYGGQGALWQEGYHDWICESRLMIDAVERYIAYNPLKWWLRNGSGRALLALHEPLESPRLGRAEYWRGVGAVALLNGDRTLLSLRVSRRCSPPEIASLVARLVAKASELTIISGFISPGEREVLAALLANPKAKIVKVSPYALAHDYAPPVALMGAIAERRLAIIARGNSPEEISRAACLDLNARIIDIADKAAYALPGELRWVK